MRTRAWSIALVLAAAALVSWLAFRHEREFAVDEALARPAGEARDVRRESGPLVVPAGTEVAAIDEPLATDPSARSTVASVGAGELLVRVTTESEGKPVEGARVYLDHRSIPKALVSRFFRYEPDFTDASGEVRLPVPAGSPLQLHVRGGGHFAARVIDVAPLAPGETRSLPVALFGGGEREFHGMVVARVSRAPIAGARIQASATWWPSEQESDAAGRFTLRGSVREGAFTVARPGFARTKVEIDEGHERPENALVVELHPSATLSVRLEGRLDRWDELDLRVSVAAEEVETRDRLRRSQDMYRSNSAEVLTRLPPEWVAEWTSKASEDATPVDLGETRVTPDAFGQCEWRDLPAGIPLSVALLGDDRVVRSTPSSIILTAGETHELVWELDATVRVTGRVVDQHGNPVGGCEVELWSTREGASAQRARQRGTTSPAWEHARAMTVTADADGRFAIDDVRPGRWWVAPGVVDLARASPFVERGQGPRAVSEYTSDGWVRHIRDPAWQAEQVIARPVSVDVAEDQEDVELELCVHRGLTISGRVTDVNGVGLETTVAASRVHEGAWDPVDWAGANTQEDGAFLLGPLLPGRYEVSATLGGKRVEFEVEAGATNVSIEF